MKIILLIINTQSNQVNLSFTSTSHLCYEFFFSGGGDQGGGSPTHIDPFQLQEGHGRSRRLHGSECQIVSSAQSQRWQKKHKHKSETVGENICW